MSSLLLISGDMEFSCGERVEAGQKSQLWLNGLPSFLVFKEILTHLGSYLFEQETQMG